MADPSTSRRTPDELRALYEIDSSLSDLFVEGETDAGLLRWYLRVHGIRQAKVFPIDDRVQLDGSAVQQAGQEAGVRRRLVTFAKLSATWGLPARCVTCAIDADRDYLYGPEEIGGLIRTDFGSMDVYAFQARPLQKFMDLVVRRDGSADELIAELTPMLNDIFLARAALHTVSVRMVSNFMACCEIRADGVRVKVEELVRRSLAASGAGLRQPEVLTLLDQLRVKLPTDGLKAVRGHDIAPAIIAKLGLANDWRKPLVVEDALRGCLSVEDLDHFPFFASIRERLE